MAKRSPEDEVKFRCLAMLESWSTVWCATEKHGVVLDYDDVSALGKHFNMYTGTWTMHTKKGKRDIIAWFRVGDVLWTYLIECKSALGVQSPAQIAYEAKWKGLKGVVYEVVSNANQISATLDRLTGRTDRLLAEAEAHMFPRKGIWIKRKPRGLHTKVLTKAR